MTWSYKTFSEGWVYCKSLILRFFPSRKKQAKPPKSWWHSRILKIHSSILLKICVRAQVALWGISSDISIFHGRKISQTFQWRSFNIFIPFPSVLGLLEMNFFLFSLPFPQWELFPHDKTFFSCWSTHVYASARDKQETMK